MSIFNDEQKARLQKLVGDSEKITDDNAVNILLSYSEHVTDEYKKVDATCTQLSASLDEAKSGQTIELSATEIALSNRLLNAEAAAAESRIRELVATGNMPKHIADKLAARVKDADGKPNGIMLSRDEGQDENAIDFVLNLFAGSKLGANLNELSGAQVLTNPAIEAPKTDSNPLLETANQMAGIK